MGHGKLRKFAENETFKCLLQPSASEVMDKSDGGFRVLDHPIKGNWNSNMFAKAQPIVLELGCGRGEYTIDLSRRVPSRNYIGVDIKGARLWQGAKYAVEHDLPNVAFLRTRIELIEAFFAPREVSEIWLTFSDPQLGSANKRLSSPVFLEKYRKFLAPGGRIHLKTDSRFLYEYTKAVAQANGLNILAATTDLYNPNVPISTSHPQLDSDPNTPRHPELDSGSNRTNAAPGLDKETMAALTDVQTFYERMFMKQGYKINYLCFTISHEGPFVAPSDFDSDYWRSIEGPRKFIQNI
ncbi:MAG: tRNA (guanosine(46)-N7)-methyltransferase TrmB [Bacteroidales bacterium]|nr:tRNA (guanosine(46)-N7)-methyltransferase TrmB [Bacteroidales bacterium]MCI2133317.1 tRNA (guanosine(46)-N7)-methyltransferase TrmB [Bacteroidales bacterium]